MSARKSFDIGPSRRKAASRTRKAASRREAPLRPSRGGKKTLRDRRREESQRKFLLIAVGLLVLMLAVIYAFWRPEIRISEITVEGVGNGDSLKALATEELEGTYFHVFPRDSFFFYPEKEIRRAIIAEHPEISTVSISRTGFNALALKTISRLPAFWWCGMPEGADGELDNCYETDAEGLVFKPAVITASTTPMLEVYAYLDTASSTNTYPLRARVLGAEQLPDILRFAKAVKTLGVPVHYIAIRDDEADLYTESGTRISYVIGRETAAAKDAQAAFPNLNLVDGSIEYVDLRFEGKVYIKRRGAE